MEGATKLAEEEIPGDSLDHDMEVAIVLLNLG